MTAPTNFAYSFIPVGIQTVGGEPLIGVVVDIPFDGTVETVADISSAEVADARIEITGSVQLEETGWGLYALDPTDATLTAPCQGIWLATIGDTGDVDSMLIAYSPLIQTSGVVDPSWDSGVAFLPFEARGVGVESIVAGANVTVNDSDPAHPIVSATGGGGGSGLPAGGGAGQVPVKQNDADDGVYVIGDVDAAHVIIDPEGDAIPVDEAFITAIGLITPLQNLPWLRPVGSVATANVDITSAPSTIDGVVPSGTTLLTNQTDPTENRIYTGTGPGNPLVPSTIHTASSQVAGARVVVTEGTVHAGETWGIATGSVNSGDAVWEDVTGAGGSGPDLSDDDPLGPGTAAEGTSPDASRSDHVHPRQGTIVNSEVSASAAIAESKLNLASDAAAGTASRRTLGTGSTQAAAGNDTRLDVAATTHAATGKTTPVDADEVMLVDSAASNVIKKLTWSNIKATLVTYFNTLYVRLTWAPTTIRQGSGGTGGTSTAATLQACALTQAIGANEEWEIDATLVIYGPTGSDATVGINTPSGATVSVPVDGPASSYSGAAASKQTQGVITASTASGATGFGVWGTGTSLAAASEINLAGVIVNGATPGSITVQWCQAVAGTTSTLDPIASRATFRRIA